MKDMKTTVTGGIAALCQLVGLLVPGAGALCDPLSAIALALMGWFAKDR